MGHSTSNDHLGTPLSRGRFLKIAGLTLGSVGGALVAACAQAPASPGPGGSPAPTTAPAAAPTTAAAPTSAAAPTAAASGTAPAASSTAPASGSAGQAQATKPAASPATTPATSAQTTGTASQRALKWGTQFDVARLDPVFTDSLPDVYFLDNLYDTMVFRAPDNSLGPGLATEWNLINPTTWQFKLRPNIKFHNGDPLTAADIKYTIDYTRDPKNKSVNLSNWDVIDHVDAVDDLTVNVVTKGADPVMPARQSTWGAQVIPMKYHQKVGDAGFGKAPVGSGPFKFVEWVKGDHLSLAAVKDYWGGAPNLDTVTQYPKTEDAARVAALQSGDINFTEFLPTDQVATIKANPKLTTATVTDDGFVMVVVNQKVKPLDNASVRQALTLAVDRQGLIKNLVQGFAVPANSSIPQGDLGYDPKRPPYPYDPEKAKSLLSSGGYKGEQIIYEDTKSDQPLAEALAGMWKAVGLNIQIDLLENAVRAQEIAQKTLKGLMWATPGSVTGDPDGLMYRLIATGGHWSYWSNADFDKLGEQARSEMDQQKRIADYQQMQAIIDQQLPWFPLYQPQRVFGLSKSYQYTPNPHSRVDLRNDNFKIVG